MSRHAHDSALEFISTRPGRRSKGESLLKQIQSTSYPHACLANLTLEYAKRAGMDSHADLSRIAEELRPIEHQMGWLDFIRCIDIKRDAESVEFVVKRLQIDPSMQAIRDLRANHEFLAQAKLTLPNKDQSVTKPESLAIMILSLFHSAQVKGRVNIHEITQFVWFKREKKLKASGKRLKDLDTDIVDTECSLDEVREMLCESLKKDRFRIIITQNTIFLMDQNCRIWNAKPDK